MAYAFSDEMKIINLGWYWRSALQHELAYIGVFPSNSWAFLWAKIHGNGRMRVYWNNTHSSLIMFSASCIRINYRVAYCLSKSHTCRITFTSFFITTCAQNVLQHERKR